MSRCPSCGGVIGRDCYNPIECAQITNSMEQADNHELREELRIINRKFDTLVELLTKDHGMDLSYIKIIEKLNLPQIVDNTYRGEDGLPF